MAKRPTKDTGGSHIKVSHLLKMVEHTEWQCRVIRLALQRLDPETQVATTAELRDLLRAEPMGRKWEYPPC